MSLTPWFERKFDFSFPFESLPNLCARLRGTTARLDDILRRAPCLLLSKKSDGAWSAQENAGHLVDLEPLWLARVRDYIEPKNELTATDLQNRRTDEANHNKRDVELILMEFRIARMSLLDLVLNLDRSFFQKSILHPRLKKPMTLLDHLHFVAEHDDHHLARIWELAGSKDLPAAGKAADISLCTFL